MKRLLFAATCLLAAVAAARADNPFGPAGGPGGLIGRGAAAELKVLSQSAGTWDVVQTVQAGGDPVQHKGTCTGQLVLGGRFLESALRTDGLEVYEVATFSPAKKTYRAWTFDARGQANYWTGQFDKGTQVLTWKARAGKNDAATRTLQYADELTGKASLVVRGGNGKDALARQERLSRADKDGKVALPEAGQPAPDLPALRELQRLVGTWEDDVTAKAAPWTPKEVRTTTTATIRWVLGGRFLHQRSANDRFMYTYDAGRRVYRMWHFNVAGYAHEWTGSWHGPTRTFSWKSDLDGNAAAGGATLKVHFPNDGAFEWKSVTKDRAGKIVHLLEGNGTRKQ